MACDTSIKARKEKKVTINENTTEIIKEKKMSSTMVLRQMPEFNMSAYDAKTGHLSKETILDKNAFLVSETDSKVVIRFANKDFCDVAGFTLEEMLGKPHSIVRHKDMPKAAFKDLWTTLQKGNVWTGYVKNSTKSGNYYWVYATIFPTTTSEGTKGFISCRRKATQEEIDEASEIYEKLKENEK